LFQASNTISSNAIINGGLGTSIHLQANNRVTLTPGFRTYSSVVFSAYLAGCGGGGIPDPVAGEEEEFIDH
jgi:hypothetical protein